ncbi:hypothetical protein ASG89_34475 [Paenibacillus sp. Soil766]|uniref:S8 family peptidase n=1 Tax=Paenibacillus sp. Soil766 TaxID=1736404 RepID=UPI00070D656A|nr:S8 family serine peptidase [Paenibacillus sp. Soil766]KRE91148.1 hypothetical protein ASG89_34475 [Paenibacillus sp. Soil766]
MLKTISMVVLTVFMLFQNSFSLSPDVYREITANSLIENNDFLELIHLPRAMQGNCSKNIVIGVVDSGLNYIPKVFKGYIINDGKNMVEDNNDLSDSLGHGTAVASIIAMMLKYSNSQCIKIMPVKVISTTGGTQAETLAKGIEYAIDKKVNIILMSLGLDDDSILVSVAVKKAEENNILVIAPTGNEGKNTIKFPAAYPTVVAVGGIDRDGKVNNLSNFGEQVDVVAPWHVEALWNNQMLQLGGTSFAAPQVAVLGAIILSNKIIPPAKLRNIIKRTSQNESGVTWSEHSGYGLINVKDALALLLSESEIMELYNTKEKSRILPIGKMEDDTITLGSEYWYLVRIAYSGEIIFTYDQPNLNLEQSLFDSTGRLIPLHENHAEVLAGDYYYLIKMSESETHSIDQVSYSLVANFVIGKDAYEGTVGNDSMENAFFLEDVNNTYLGNFSRTDDHDFFKINFKVDSTVRINISVNTARIDPACLLFYRGREEEIDNGSAGDPEEIELQVHSGDNLGFELYNKLNLSSAASGEYKIEVKISHEPQN